MTLNEMLTSAFSDAAGLYNAAARGFLVVWLAALPAQLFVLNAPFGRFTPKSQKWTVDGIKAWMIMESVSPVALLTSYLKHPLSKATPPIAHPATLLVGLYVAHYANRAIISPLRTPNRSRAHLVIPLAASLFNTFNGALMGAYLSSSIRPNLWTSNPLFWPGVALFVLGLAGNIVHDEVLLDLRRSTPHGPDGKPHYAIPYGWLYRWISYPNYFCEWVEWLGFAIAACPKPTTVAAPWLFFIAEIAVMLPRALRGHEWYHDKFKDYPRERKAVIPFLL
ncbi:3-oxo-5-alpha-steroid 4-dehydrogenase-domain-containing protein [Auriculariales sp. MPI-PUGE-AT-0066]|nr:3-oxo-5-alpha-steroid 4-dehydrogenase-domain-containing protein [Auriculariales sp. MPI-PUGE-AT-0066]